MMAASPVAAWSGPALQRLLAEVAGRRLDVIVVYKVDRLTRSLADFAKLVELFDARGVSFVSVTQSFNTTTSMGRLTLNVLLSFAQFEREVTGERIRDKIAASKKKGLWMGGVVPLGYRVESRKLLIDEAEAETVRLIFRRYLEIGSLSGLQADLRQRGIRRRSRIQASENVTGDIAFTNGPLAHMLRNRMYLGDINHRGTSYKGEHAALVDAELFEAVQVKLAGQRNANEGRKGKSDALLTGRLVDSRGNAMTPSHTLKKGVRYRYYVSVAIVQGRKAEAGAVARVPAPDIEQAIIAALRDRIEVASCDDAVALRRAIDSIDLRVVLRSAQVELSWIVPVHADEATASTAERGLQAGAEVDPGWNDEQRCRLVVPFTVDPHKRRREIILPVDAQQVRPIRAGEQQNLVFSIAQGRAWLAQIVAGATASSIAAREQRTERMVRMTVSLAFLDPILVRAILQGSLPRGTSVRRLIDAPASWHEQWQTLGLTRPA